MSVADLIEAIGVNNLILIGAALSVAMTLFLVSSIFIERDPMRNRVREIQAYRDALLAQRGARDNRGIAGGMQSSGALNSIAAWLRRVQGEQADRIRTDLARAGWRSTEAIGLFIVGRIVFPIVMFALAGAFALTIPAIADRPVAIKLLILVAAAVLGYLLPQIIVDSAASGRRKKLQRALPDALDLMVICTESGLGLDAAFDRVSREFARSYPEMADELSLISVELSILPNRHEALSNFSKRCKLPDADAVVGTLIQTERYGTPLAQSLRVLSNDFRERRMLRAEEKAARLPATLTVPMILFILPVLFIVIMGPAIIQAIDAFN